MNPWKTYQAPSVEEMSELRAKDAEAQHGAKLLKAATAIEDALRQGQIGFSTWLEGADARAVGECFASRGWCVAYETLHGSQRVIVRAPR